MAAIWRPCSVMPPPRRAKRWKNCTRLAARDFAGTVSGMSNVIAIETAVEKLSVREREEFAEWYEGRLAQVGPDPEIDKLWTVEVQRRLEEIRSGKVQAIPGEPVMAELRRRYGA